MWQKKLKPNLSRRNIINLVALIIIVYLGVATFRVIAKNYKLQQEVDSLRNEIELLQLENEQLQYQIAYYQTDSFADREARDKLGLQAPGETVVIFPDKVPPLSVSEAEAEPERPAVEQALSNLQQWLYFLFKIEPE